MPNPGDNVSGLFRSIGPDESSFQVTANAMEQGAEQRWPLFKVVLPQKHDLPPALSAEEQKRWEQQHVTAGEQPVTALSLPGFGEKLAENLRRMSARATEPGPESAVAYAGLANPHHAAVRSVTRRAQELEQGNQTELQQACTTEWSTPTDASKILPSEQAQQWKQTAQSIVGEKLPAVSTQDSSNKSIEVLGTTPSAAAFTMGPSATINAEVDNFSDREPLAVPQRAQNAPTVKPDVVRAPELLISNEPPTAMSTEQSQQLSHEGRVDFGGVALQTTKPVLGETEIGSMAEAVSSTHYVEEPLDHAPRSILKSTQDNLSGRFSSMSISPPNLPNVGIGAFSFGSEKFEASSDQQTSTGLDAQRVTPDDQSLTAVFGRLEEKGKSIRKPVGSPSSFLSRLGKR